MVSSPIRGRFISTQLEKYIHSYIHNNCVSSIAHRCAVQIIFSSVQMRLYTLSRSHFMTLCLLCICTVLVVGILGLTGPDIIGEHLITFSKKSDTIDQRPFVIRSPDMSIFNQEIWLSCVIVRNKEYAGSGVLIPLNVTLSIDVNSEQTRNLVLQKPTHLPLLLTCFHRLCNELLLAHIIPIDFAQYIFTLDFVADEASQNKFTSLHVDEIQFTVHYITVQFTHFEILSKFLCLLVNAIVTAFYIMSFRKFALRDWNLEQKFTAVLLFALILFNNPFYPLVFFTRSALAYSLDSLFHAVLYCTIFCGWLYLYHGMRISKRGFVRFYLIKFALVAVPTLVCLIFVWWRLVHDFANPMFLATQQNYGFAVVMGICVWFVFVYVLLLSILCYRAHTELAKLPHYGLRLRVLDISTFVTAGIIISCLMVQYGPSRDWKSVIDLPANSHNLPRTMHWWRRSTSSVALLWAGLNSYATVLALLYSPSKNALRDANFKDNPLVSMVNDSEDEDVIYQSASDETIRLTALH